MRDGDSNTRSAGLSMLLTTVSLIVSSPISYTHVSTHPRHDLSQRLSPLWCAVTLSEHRSEEGLSCDAGCSAE